MNYMDTEENDDRPFDAQEVRMWSVRTMSRFLVVGLPRLIFLILIYIFFLPFGFMFHDGNYHFQNILFKIISRFKLYVFGFFKVDISKKDRDILRKSDAQVIVVNHSSYLDCCVVDLLIPDTKYIASEFISKMPLFKQFLKTKCIFLGNDFKSGNITEKIQRELDKGTRIVFFSSGVCSRPEFVLKLRNGAFVPKLKILSVHVNYYDKFWVMGEQDMNAHIINTMSSFRNKVSVRVLPDYIPSEDEKKDIDLFRENYRKYYASGFGLKLSNKSYKDHPYYRHKMKD
jgi:1-acyl-sn-glycerol-3-phosphate acyltransferase